jgi:hypothetical protein
MEGSAKKNKGNESESEEQKEVLPSGPSTHTLDTGMKLREPHFTATIVEPAHEATASCAGILIILHGTKNTVVFQDGGPHCGISLHPDDNSTLELHWHVQEDRVETLVQTALAAEKEAPAEPQPTHSFVNRVKDKTGIGFSQLVCHLDDVKAGQVGEHKAFVFCPNRTLNQDTNQWVRLLIKEKQSRLYFVPFNAVIKPATSEVV